MGLVNIAWDDFTGGYFVGPRASDQPRNTWTGDDLWIDATTGDLMPMPRLTAASLTWPTASTPTYNTGFSHPVRAGASGLFAWFHDEDGTGTNWRVYTANLNTDLLVQRTSTVAVSSATATGIAFGRPAIGPVSAVLHLILGDGGTQLIRYNISSGAITASTISGGIGKHMLAYGQRIVSWGNTTYPHRLFYSDADAVSTWQTTSYYNVGSPATPILAVAATTQSLLIGKPEGWWELRGTLGSTASILPIVAGHGPPSETSAGVEQTTPASAIHVPGGLTIYDGNGVGVTALALAGIQPRAVNHRPNTDYLQWVRGAASGVVISSPDSDEKGWIFDGIYGRWHRYTVPSSLSGVLRWRWALDPLGLIDLDDPYADPYGVTMMALVDTTASTTRTQIVVWDGGLRRHDPPADLEATVQLSDSDTPVGAIDRAKSMVVEVAVGSSVPSGTARCTVTLDAIGSPDSPAAATSTTYTWERHGSQLEAEGRYVFRVNPNDLPAATCFRPTITLENVKLRRVSLTVDREAMRAS